MPRKDSLLISVAKYSGMAFTVPAAVVAGYAIGYFADQSLGTHYWYIVGVILGAVGGLVQVVRQLMQDTGDGGG